MLTKSDLNAIDKIVSSRVRGEVDPLKKTVGVLQEDITVIKQQVKPIKSMQRDIRKIKTDIEGVIDHFDKRVKKVDDFLRIQPLKS